MNWADWAIVAILGFSILISIVRGFIREALSLLIWAAAFVGATVFHQEMAGYFASLVDTPSLRALVAWVVLFFGILMAGSLLSFLLGQLVETTGLSGTDRLLGSVFGALRGFIVVMVVLIILPGVLPVSQDSWWQNSLLIPYFLACEDWVMDTGSNLLAFFKSLF
ncbi:MAG: CvpA family protein [Porticoccaceae bacterium]|nr:CvpA family protein [Porticoccaceae bacterium]